VRFINDSSHPAPAEAKMNRAASFDHLVGAGEQGSRNFVRAIISSLATAPPGDDLVRAARICAGSLELV
jgi:hypothetical protein